MNAENRPNNELGGFANRQFVLINGSIWNSKVNRRYVQGQVWLTEFTGLLLQCFLPQNDPLARKGSSEILKYTQNNAHGIQRHNSKQGRPNQLQRARFVSRLEDNIRNIRLLRNEMTHDVGEWNETTDKLKKLLEKMATVFELVGKRVDQHDNLHFRLTEFISSCEKELKQMVQHPNLY